MKSCLASRAMALIPIVVLFGACGLRPSRPVSEFADVIAGVNAVLKSHSDEYQLPLIQFHQRANCVAEVTMPWPESNAKGKGFEWAKTDMRINFSNDIERAEFLPSHDVVHETWTERWNAHFRLHFRHALDAKTTQMPIGGQAPMVSSRRAEYITITGSDEAPMERNTEILQWIGRLSGACTVGASEISH